MTAVSVDGVLSALNPVIGAVLRSPLHRLLSAGLMLLTVTGRHSGRRYTIPVGYQQDGNDLVVMVSEARRKQWWRNYYEPGPVALQLRGQARSGRHKRTPMLLPSQRIHAPNRMRLRHFPLNTDVPA